MAENKKKTEVIIIEPDIEAVPDINTELFLAKLEGMLEECYYIAEHFRMTARDRWIHEYLVGRFDAYTEITSRVFDGEFDRVKEED